MKKILSVLLALTFLIVTFTGCSLNKGDDNTNSNNNLSSGTENNDGSSNAEPVEVDFSSTDEDMFTDRDKKTEYDESKAIKIKLNGNSATATSQSVKISGSTVTITEEATYVISGELNDGKIIIDAPDTAKLQIVFNGVNITSETFAALYILEVDKVFLTLPEGTENTLTNGGSFTAIDENNVDATLFSKQDLTINGSGSLTVSSPAGHGVVCKDDLVITGGTFEVNSASHGIEANDSVRVTNASLTIDAGKDAIHSENNDDSSKGFVYISTGTDIKAAAEGDGITAGAFMQIADGTIDLLVGGGSENGSKEHSDSFGGFMGGGRPGGMPGGMQHGNMQGNSMENSTTTNEEDSTSMKGLKAENVLLISGGNITMNSADDSIHSNTSVIINGGNFEIASGDDAIHAEENLTVSAGEINISESYEGLEALRIEITGGNTSLVASDDGLNAAGGTDQSGFTGGRDGMFGGGKPGRNGVSGGMSSNSNGSIKVSGGNLYIKSSGDGMDANGTLEISGGYTVVVGPTQGDTATLDYDTSGVITGGTFIGTGASGMAQTFSDSQQGVIAMTVGNRSAETEIVLKDAKGNTIITHKPALDFALVILSSPELVKGETYKVSIGTDTGEIQAN